jgi:hypothetical protein
MKTLFAILVLSSFVFSQMENYFSPRITNVEISKTTVQIYYRQDPGVRYCEGGGPPDIVWKEIYKIKNGELYKDTVLYAQVIEFKAKEEIKWNAPAP